MDKQTVKKYLGELDKVLEKQKELFQTYANEHPEILEWTTFFSKLQEEFEKEIIEEKKHIIKQHNYEEED